MSVELQLDNHTDRFIGHCSLSLLESVDHLAMDKAFISRIG